MKLIQFKLVSYHLKPSHLFKNVANPGCPFLFHFLYFPVGVRKNIAAYRKVLRKIIRNSVQETFVALPQNYQQVHITGRSESVGSVRAKEPDF